MNIYLYSEKKYILKYLREREGAHEWGAEGEPLSRLPAEHRAHHRAQFQGPETMT